MKPRLRWLLGQVVLWVLLLLPAVCAARPIDGRTAHDVAQGFAASTLSPAFSVRQPITRGESAVRPFYGPDGTLLAYVVDLQPKGFIIVPSDDSVEPILAYSTEGNFIGELTPNNVLADMLIQDIPHRMGQASSVPTPVRGEIAGRWTLLRSGQTAADPATRSAEDGIYGPLITDEWDQIPPYNRFDDEWPSDVPAGCVATAMAMIIHYMQHPPRAFVENMVSVCGASAPGRFDDTFNYALMPRRLDASSSPAQVQEVANLLRACGIAAGMDYCFGSSEATHAYARWAYMDFFDYDTALFVKPEWCDWLALVKSETASGYPVQMGISSVAHGFGHSVVCDGSRAVGSTEYVHLNMGWSGVGNTWYQVLQSDTGAEWLLLDLICGIRPPGPQRVATPNLAPDNGSSGQPVLVTVSCPTAGAVMHYDTAGNWDETPTQDDQVIASGASILVDKPLELKVRAWKPGWIPSDIKRASYRIAGKVATPSFNPDGGTFYVPKTVTITCATEGATIRYTTNDKDPVEADPKITSGGSVTVNKTTVLKAKAWKSGVAASDVKSATYTLRVATPAFSPAGGTIPEPTSVAVTCSTPGAVIHYTTNDKDPVEADPKITSGATVRIAASTVLRAKAWKTGWSSSEVSRAAYTLRQPTLIYVDKLATGPTHDGQTWPTAFTGIQEALNAADVGGEVWVAEGTYDEAIVLKPGVALYGGFAGTELSRMRRDLTANITLIRPVWAGASALNAVVRVLPGADAMTCIDGFSITGTDPLDSDVGCGISCDSGSPTIANNVIGQCAKGGISCSDGSPIIEGNTITGCTSAANGGAISCLNCSAEIRRNKLLDNAASGKGGAIYCLGGSPKITENIISSNACGTDGSGIACSNCESVEIRGNLLSDNTASSGAAVGGAVYCIGSQSAVVSNNRVEANAGSGECGGIVCAASSGTICNNLILGNTASGVGGIKCAASVGADTNLSVVNNTIARNSGPGIKCDAPVTILVANNIIALNSAGIRSTGQASVSLRNNCLYGNSEYTYYGVSPGTGDMLSDPLVADMQSDNWRLLPGSPCIDAGDDGSAPASGTDVDGQARIFGAHIDIGADEYVPEGVLYGIAMVSLPIIPSASDPKQVMQFDGNMWFAYSPATKAYAAYPNRATWFEPTSATPGRGFWARFSQPVPLPTGGVPAQGEAVSIHLLPGWNIIGNPFLSPLRWDLSAMMVRGSTGVAKTYRDSLNLVAPYAWGWRQDPADPYHGAYYAISDPSYMVGEDTLQPWAACWLKAKQACDLVLPPPGGSPENPPEPPPWP